MLSASSLASRLPDERSISLYPVPDRAARRPYRYDNRDSTISEARRSASGIVEPELHAHQHANHMAEGGFRRNVENAADFHGCGREASFPYTPPA